MFGRNRKSEKYIALDIGTEVVKALVFEIDESEKRAVVVGVGKVLQKPGNMRSGAVSHIQGVIDSSREALDIAKKKAKIHRSPEVILGIAGELVKGITTTVHYERMRPETRIDISELKEIVRQVQHKAYERIREQLSWETGQKSIDIKLVNAAIVDVRIDGYKVTSPIGFQGRDVSISVFNAYAPIVHLGALEKIADELEVEVLAVAAEPYAVSRSVMEEDSFDFNATFIDIGGGTTDVAVVRNGGLEGTKMFALGGRAFTKRLAQVYATTFDEAEKLKIAHSRGRLDTNVRQGVRETLSEDSRIWLGGLEMALAEFSENQFLPPKLLLCGGGSGLEEIREALMTTEWTKSLSFSHAPQVSFLHPRDIKRVIDGTGELTTPQDVTPMSLASLVVEILDEEKLLSGILRRTTKKM